MSIWNEKQVINFGTWNLVIHTKIMFYARLGRNYDSMGNARPGYGPVLCITNCKLLCTEYAEKRMEFQEAFTLDVMECPGHWFIAGSAVCINWSVIQSKTVFVDTWPHGMARPQVANRGDGLQIWKVAANIFNKQSHTASGVVLQLGGWSKGKQLLTIKKKLLRIL